MLAEAARRARREPMSLSPKAAAQLLRHTWPGNVRELQNAMEHAVALAPEPRIQAEDLPEELHLASPGPWVNGALRPLEEMEREYILAVLRAHGGNRTHAARTLGIGAATLFRKLRHYQVPPHPQRPHGRARRPSLT
jgi:DNA-binding NtrC family response regulator